MKTDKQYLEDPNKCPNCNDESLTVGMAQVDSSQGWQYVSCESCGLEYKDIFQLTGFEVVSIEALNNPHLENADE